VSRRLVILGVAAAAVTGAVVPTFAATAPPSPVTVHTSTDNGVSLPPTRQSLPVPPVVLQHDDNGTVVGVGDVGVSVSNSGRICPEVSTQSWVCING